MSFTTTHHTASRLRLLGTLIGVAAWVMALALTVGTVVLFIALRTGAMAGAPVVTTGFTGLVVFSMLVSWIWAYHARGVLTRGYAKVVGASSEDREYGISTRAR